MRWVLITATVALYWLLMMAVHESGHALLALCTGGHVTRVILHPLAISRTDVSPNSSPLAVVWGGPTWGSLLPVLIWLIWRAAHLPAAKWLQGFAGFCLIANGFYIASGAAFPAGDTEDLLRLGVSHWMLAAVGTPVALAGLWLWHRLGPMFGMAAMTPRQLRFASGLTLIGLFMVVVAMLVFSRASAPA